MSQERFDAAPHIARMALTAPALHGLLAELSPDDARWKPRPEDWSILEIINHLADEEVEDFRTRVDLTLHQPGIAWPPIDPPRAAIERAYNMRELSQSIQRFVNEREASLRWLRALQNPDWSRIYAHPSLGAMTAAELVCSWAAHDALQLRQIARRLYDLTQRDAGGRSTSYAGEWNPGR